MKKLFWLAALYSGLACAQQSAPYPAGIWTGFLVDGANAVFYFVTLSVLPSGSLWGIVDETAAGSFGAPGCPYLVRGNLVRGGLAVEFSVVTESSSGFGPSACPPQAGTVWGSSKITLTSATTARWSVNNPRLKNTFSLTLWAAVYDQPSSFKALAGYWSSDMYTEIVTPTGDFIAVNQELGCIGSGQYTIVNASHGLYSFTERLYNCDSSAFNGARSGVAHIDKSSGEAILTKQSALGNGAANVVESNSTLLRYGH